MKIGVITSMLLKMKICGDREIVNDVWKNCNVFIFMVLLSKKNAKSSGLLDPKDEGTMIFQSVFASRHGPRRLEYLFVILL